MLKQICELAIDAGSAIMEIYHAQEPLQVEQKSDKSPVTAADIAAHQIITAGLTRIAPDIPQLSEEDPLHGMNAKVGNGIGWLIHLMAQKNLFIVMGILPLTLP